jgi:hypothetical protein
MRPFMTNVVSYLDSKSVSWSGFAFDTDGVAGVSVWEGPYTLVAKTGTSSVPWATNVNGTPLVDSMLGQPMPTGCP